MKTVLGLFEQRTSAEAAAAAAQKAGVPEHRIKLMNSATPASELVEPGPRQITTKAILGFTVMMVLIFGLFGLAAAIGSIYVFDATTGIAVATFVVFLVIGAFCGLFMGWIMGRSDADNAIQEFREAVQHGDTLLVVESDKHDKVVAQQMRSGSAHWVAVAKQVNPMRTYSPLLDAGHTAPAH